MRTVTRYTASCGRGTRPGASLPSRTWLARRAGGVYGPRDRACVDHGTCTRQNLEPGWTRFLQRRPAWVVA